MMKNMEEILPYVLKDAFRVDIALTISLIFNILLVLHIRGLLQDAKEERVESRKVMENLTGSLQQINLNVTSLTEVVRNAHR